MTETLTTKPRVYKRGAGDCARCGRPTPRKDRVYCDDCKEEAVSAAVAASNKRRWAEYRAQGIDPLHGGEAARLRGEAIAQSNRQNPRRRAKEWEQ